MKLCVVKVTLKKIAIDVLTVVILIAIVLALAIVGTGILMMFPIIETIWIGIMVIAMVGFVGAMICLHLYSRYQEAQVECMMRAEREERKK